MSKYTKQWLKLLKAEANHKRKAIAKRTQKLFDSIFEEDDTTPKYLNGKASNKNHSSE